MSEAASVLARVPSSVRTLFSPADADRLLSLRRAIHADPELSGNEHRTAAKLEEQLATLSGVAFSRVAGTGIIARIPGVDRSVAPVALRGDIDALPIAEATGLPFASRVDGVMHACGHDVHATWAFGAAMLLARAAARGDVLVVFQPSEETGQGARAVVDSGALDGVTAMFGGHVDRRFPVGDVVADDGPLAASADTFELVLTASGAHAARPHETRDVIVAAAHVVTALQTIVSRRLNPATPGVVTVGAIHAGEAANVIPDRAVLRGTVRAVDAQSRAMMLEEVRRVATGVSDANGTGLDVRIGDGTPPVFNPQWPTSIARAAAVALLGASHVVPLGTTNLAAEDFAFYGERIPSSFLRIGAREEGGEFVPAHSPRFFAADASVFVGAAVLAECARRASGERPPVAG